MTIQLKSLLLLEDLLLNQTAGAGSSINNQIDLSMDIFCELNNADKEGLKEQLKIAYNRMWSPGWYYDEWSRLQHLYALEVQDILTSYYNKGQKPLI